MTQSLPVLSRLGGYASTIELLHASGCALLELYFFSTLPITSIAGSRLPFLATVLPENMNVNNDVFGWKFPILVMNGLKARKVLENLQKSLFESCNTVQVKILFGNVISPVEPENLKTKLSSNFNDWTITPRRKHAFSP